jgi:hypothetical protein
MNEMFNYVNPRTENMHLHHWRCIKLFKDNAAELDSYIIYTTRF